MSNFERQNLSIYLVDDEEMITRSLAYILRSEGFLVTPFNNPLKALSRIGRDAPDLLISDVMMPELSGLQLATEAKKILPACNILLFSGAADHLLQQAGEQGIGFRLLSKPLHPTTLLDEIAKLTLRCPPGSFQASAQAE